METEKVLGAPDWYISSTSRFNIVGIAYALVSAMKDREEGLPSSFSFFQKSRDKP